MRLIDADAFLEEARNRIDMQDEYLPIHIKYFVIDEMPTIDAEPVRHGKWIKDRLVSTSGGTYGIRRCSLCEAYYQDVGCRWSCCPHCGAKMDADEISNIAKESADKIAKVLKKVRAKGMQKQNIKEDDEP